MKILSIFTLFLLAFNSYAQIDSIEFKISDLKFSKINLNEATLNKNKLQSLPTDLSYIISIDNTCNLIAPKYSDLNEGEFNFYKMKGDIETSLSILGSKLSFDKKSEYFSLVFNRYAKITCNRKKLNYGVGFYVIIKVSNIKTKVEIKNIYDLSAMGQLNLASITIDTRHFGLKPEAADMLIPENISTLDVESSKFFDGLLNKIKTILNDNNTQTMKIPSNF